MVKQTINGWLNPIIYHL